VVIVFKFITMRYIKGIVITAFFLTSLSAKAQSLQAIISRHDTTEALKLIHAGTDVNAVDNSGTSPLMSACRWNDITMIRMLLANGAKTNAPRSPKGRTPLMIACAYYSGISIARLLVENGAEVNAVANDGTTALMMAAHGAKLDVVEYLLSKGADPTRKDGKGLTALDYATNAPVKPEMNASITDTRIDKDAVIARLTALK
jgi:ankyrin repeat protein